MELAINALILGVLLIAIVQFLASRSFRARGLSLGARLRSSPPTVDVSAALPPVVRDFALRNGADPKTPVRAASFVQSGTMRLKPGGQMVPLSAWQVSALGGPGFFWDGRIDGGTLRQVRVFDAYVDGRGRLEARLIGSYPLARAEDDETTLGEAFRYLAELPWLPDAITGNPQIIWTVISPKKVAAALETSVGQARVEFDLNAEGDFASVLAKGRPARDLQGKSVRYDWRGTFGEYQQIGPRRIPASAEVGYVYPDGYEMYFRARVADYRLST